MRITIRSKRHHSEWWYYLKWLDYNGTSINIGNADELTDELTENSSPRNLAESEESPLPLVYYGWQLY